MTKLLAIAACALSLSAAACSGDTVDLASAPPAEAGVMVDGVHAPGAYEPRNDVAFLTTGTSVSLGPMISGDSNEVFVFTADRRPAYLATPWTNDVDHFTVTQEAPIAIPMTIWIVSGPYLAQRNHAMEAILRTTQIWRDERIGLAFGAITFMDATADPQAASVENFPNGDFGDAVGWAPIRAAIGFTAGQLNIYWVNTVNGATTSGWSNFGAQIAMGRNSGDELLVHEIGHALSLTHTGLPNFDQTNIMASASDTRAFITEGQIVRAHLNPGSILRATYTYPAPVPPARQCNINDATDQCPRIERRIWADGAFPANN